jgi:hypothetical protein
MGEEIRVSIWEWKKRRGIVRANGEGEEEWCLKVEKEKRSGAWKWNSEKENNVLEWKRE